MFVNNFTPAASVRFGNEAKNIIQAQYSGAHSSILSNLLAKKDLNPRLPLITVLDKTDFEQLEQTIPAMKNSKLKVDFNRQAVILVAPRIPTSTGMARLNAKSATYTPKEGLTLNLEVKYPSGLATADMGSPWALVVVDKQYADKPLKFNVLPEFFNPPF